MNDPVDPNMQSGGQDPQSQSMAGGQGMADPNATAGQSGTPTGGGLSGIMDEDVDVGNLVANASQNQQDSAALMQMPIPPHPNTTFDEKKFLELLTGSISLTVNEKRKIIEAIPQLSQFQIDELIKIFEEEKGKFAELEKQHAEQVAELEKQHGSAVDIQAQQQEQAQRDAEAEEQARLRKQLGLE